MLQTSNFSSFGIPGGFRHMAVLIAMTAHNFIDPYVRQFLVQQNWDNEYSRIITNGLVALIIYLCIEFVADVLADNNSLSNQDSKNYKNRLQEFKEFAVFFIVLESILIGILCFITYKDIKQPLLQSWGIAGSIGVSYMLLQWYRSTKEKNAPKRSIQPKKSKEQKNGLQYISFKEADALYDIAQLIKNNTIDDIDREYDNDDMLILYKGDTTLHKLHWDEKGPDNYIGIIVDGNLQVTKGIKNTEHMEQFLYVTNNLTVSYIVNFDTLIHIDGDLFISDYLYGDSFFGYIQCLGQLYAPKIISNGQQIEAQKLYSDQRIDVSDFSPTHPLYTYGLKDVVEEILENINYKKNSAELDEEKLLEYLKKGKQILR
ncbi:hypothetical protein [Aquimarina mytili]|uniref:Uncharacterized protein n=1 Tax=Aquimarina mytili TaxID=874423 RepID=A0A936ZNY2_9FLAO|nr:hypothetical protein [Aquimarina mytili]MBL0682742.1 hypothetical protein [Aquimarina mytili]